MNTDTTLEIPLHNDPKTFVPDYGATLTPGGDIGKARDFELPDFLAQSKSEKRKFTYDSETARNFDKTNVDRAREGVIEILEDAMEKAKTRARAVREEARQTGFQEGHADGFKKGEADAQLEFTPLLETLSNAIAEMSRLRAQMFPKMEREMLEMIVGLAKKIILHELTVRENSIQEMLRIGIQSVVDRESMVIRVHPRDKEHAENYRPEILEMFGGIKNIQFVGDPSIQRGGCIIDTNFGTVDARLEKLDEQLDRILLLAPHIPDTTQPQ
jgi:flagellar assembly protein FliH